MPGPPPHIAARRARRRAQLRRQRLLVLSATLAALVLLAIALIEFPDGDTTRLPRPSGGSSVSPPAALTAGSHEAVEQADHGADRAASAAIRRLLRLGLPIYCGGPHDNAVAFTFDDGPGIYTHYALKKLAEAHERTTFFDVGRSIDNWPGYLTRELKVGAVEDHTYTHVALIALPPSQITYQLQATAVKIQTETGEHVELWRPHTNFTTRPWIEPPSSSVCWTCSGMTTPRTHSARTTRRSRETSRLGYVPARSSRCTRTAVKRSEL